MSEPLFSPSWYRVAKLKPRLRGHVHLHRHDYRGEVWFILQDHAKGQYYRFTPAAQQIIGRMDGRRTVQELWESASEQLGDDGPTQGEVVQLMSQLHGADAIVCDVPPDTAELLRRSERIARARRLSNVRSPLALRFPLLDPDRFLSRTVGLVRPWFGIGGFVLWLAVVGTAVVQAGLHWPELTENLSDRVLSAHNMLILWLAYPLVKALHELGHAYAVKVWGGEVHEIGIMLLVLMPVPYVDASAASEFRARHRRVVVGAAGILVELLVASLALFLWLAMEPGLGRSLAYNVILIGSVSTVLFNGNPLLRFDGYYIFSDLIDIPNLAQRGQQYLGYLVQRFAFGMKNARPPYAGPGERFWFVTFTVTAFVYRIFVYFAIVLLIAGKFFFIGIVLAAWAAFSMVVVPVFKGLRFVVTGSAVREKRTRAFVTTAAALAVVALALFVVPVPLRTRAEGVVWAPEDALVRAGTHGFVRCVQVEPGARVRKDQLLIETRDPLLTAQVAVLRARVEELHSRHDAALATDRVQAQIVAKELGDAEAALRRSEQRLAEQEIRSPEEGILVVPGAQDLPGRYVRQGELMAYVLDRQRPTIRVVVPQSEVDFVRRRTRAVGVRLAERLAEVKPAVVRREVPEAENRLPSTVLGSVGGGAFAIDPTDAGGTRTFTKLFQFDVELVEPLDEIFVGSRAYVRFDHGTEPLAYRFYRDLRRMFLRRFHV